jgi:hypothetical protein
VSVILHNNNTINSAYYGKGKKGKDIPVTGSGGP